MLILKTYYQLSKITPFKCINDFVDYSNKKYNLFILWQITYRSFLCAFFFFLVDLNECNKEICYKKARATQVFRVEQKVNLIELHVFTHIPKAQQCTIM